MNRSAGVLFVILFALAPGEAGATLWVDGSSSSVEQDGSLDHPFLTLGAAVEAADSGEVIRVLPGVYSESLELDKTVSIEGTEQLGVVIETGNTSWRLDATGISLRHLRFVGPGSGLAIRASRPFTVERCHIESYYRAFYLKQVYGDTAVRHCRIIDVTQPINIRSCGYSNYVAFENNVIIGQGGSFGVYMRNSRARFYHNLVSGFSHGFRYYATSGFYLPISYILHNLITDVSYGISVGGAQPHSVKGYTNAISASSYATSGFPAGDEIRTIDDGCGAPTSGWDTFDCGFVPDGACIDGALFGTDPDGTTADIGPYGGDHGGPSWLPCVGNAADCLVPGYQSLLSDPLISSALQWFDGTPWPWPEPLGRRLRCNMAFYDAFGEFAEPPTLPEIQEHPNISPWESWQSWPPHQAEATFLAHASHRLWIEQSGQVPWSILDETIYTDEDREHLLSANAQFSPTYVQWAVDTGWATDWDPRFASDYTTDFVAAGHEETMAAIVNDLSCMRHTFGHPSHCYFHYSIGWTPTEAILATRWHQGCHANAGLLIALGNSINIPTYYLTTETYMPGQHGGISFPTFGRHIIHGDDIDRTTFAGDVTGLAVMLPDTVAEDDHIYLFHSMRFHAAEAGSVYWQWETCPNGWMYHDEDTVWSVIRGSYIFFGYSEAEADLAANEALYDRIIPAREAAGGCEALAWIQGTADFRSHVCSAVVTYYPDHLAECVLPYCDPQQILGWDQPECRPDW